MQVWSGLIALLALGASAALAAPPALSEHVPCYPGRYDIGISAWFDAENGVTFFTTFEIPAEIVTPDAPSAVVAAIARDDYAKMREIVTETGRLPAAWRAKIRPIDLGHPADSAILARQIEVDPTFRNVDLQPNLVSLCRGGSGSLITLGNRSESLDG